MSKIFAMLSLFFWMSCLFAQDLITVSGVGRATIEQSKRKKEEPLKVQAAAQEAERNAQSQAVRQGILQVFGDESKLASVTSLPLESLLQLGLPALRSSNVVETRRDGDEMVVVLSAQLSRRQLVDILKTNGISLAVEAESDLRVFVLSYTVEGMDAEVGRPLVTREEVHDIQTNIQDDRLQAASNKEVSIASHQKQAEFQKSQVKLDDRRKHSSSEKSEEKGDVNLSAEESNSVALLGKTKGGATASNSAEGEAHHQSASEQSDSASSSVKLDARDHHASSSEDQRSRSEKAQNYRQESSYNNTSSEYHRITVYADPTKKGAGQTNEVRTLLEGMLHKAGLNTATLEINLMGQSFEHEDALRAHITESIRKEHHEVSDKDFIAIALNRTTPLMTTTGNFKYAVSITYRIFRLQDGYQLLSSQGLMGESETQGSADEARMQATTLALAKYAAALEAELGDAIKRLGRTQEREADHYRISVKNVASPLVVRPIEKALLAAGFGVSPEFRAGTAILEVQLNGQSTSKILDTLESLLDGYTFEKATDVEMVLAKP